MTLKTNPLIDFCEYDSVPDTWLYPKEKITQVETKHNTNPFLEFSEYETAAGYENGSEKVGWQKRKGRGRNVNSMYKRKGANKMNGNRKEQIQEKSNRSSTTYNTKSKKDFKNRLKRKRSENVFKPQEESVTGPQKTWGLSVPQVADNIFSNSGLLAQVVDDGFNWNATAKDLARVVSNTVGNDSGSEESDEEISVKRKKMTPAEKREKALQDEKSMKRKEKELLEAEENPQSPDHFERLLIGSPNSAELWIKYMGYHAVNADIEKARAIARRGIKRIDPQLTSSKLDIWIALLNLEHTFCPPETFKETFAEALKCNDDYAINSRVLSLYADTKNVSEVDQLTNIMIKKYKTNVENWLQCQNALMTVGLFDKARNLLQKALAVLTKKEHVTLISRFALLENKYGFHEQAQALFENLLTSFPQRLDLLSVYVDMLIKSESINLARSVLERAASNSMPVRKMRSVYMKWIAFEEIHGKPSDVAAVEEAAKQYVSNVLRPHRVESTHDYTLKLGNNTKQEDGSKPKKDDSESDYEDDGSLEEDSDR